MGRRALVPLYDLRFFFHILFHFQKTKLKFLARVLALILIYYFVVRVGFAFGQDRTYKLTFSLMLVNLVFEHYILVSQRVWIHKLAILRCNSFFIGVHDQGRLLARLLHCL